jgi:RNA polymerase sigma-70 factor, ECF subfamily
MAFIENKCENTFKTLYERLKPGLIVHANNIVKNQQAAEDIVTDSFMKMWNKIDQYNPFWNFSTWAYIITKNEARQWIRKNGNVYSADSMGGVDVIMSDALSIDNGINLFEEANWEVDEEVNKTELLYAAVMDQIRELPELYKQIMVDREVHGMKYKDISEKYDLELNTVKTRIKRAREKICKETASIINYDEE